MRIKKIPYVKVFVVALVMVTTAATCQIPNFSTVPNIYPGDSAAIVSLIKNGTKVSKGQVIAWFPKDSLSAKRMSQIVDTLNIGVVAAEKFIKAPHAWQVHKKGTPYTFYFITNNIISHASGAGFVSISFWRIKSGKAPWLHEAVHEMLNSNVGNWLNDAIPDDVWMENMPLWLSEGLPDYVNIQVSQKNRLRIFDVFSNSRMTNIDSACRKDLKGDVAEAVLPYIGKKGAMPELSGKDRRLYAPTFYHCSCSFVKFLVEQVGIDPLISSIAAHEREMEELEKQTPASLAELKRLWLLRINESR